jgi:hypothetical protein
MFSLTTPQMLKQLHKAHADRSTEIESCIGNTESNPAGMSSVAISIDNLRYFKPKSS